jgi:RNA-directed DNA polymerase
MTLLERLYDKAFLNQAWLLLNRDNVDSYGFSRTTIADFEKELEQNLIKISKEIQTGKFEFSKLRAAIIPKPNGKFRPLQISEIRDRVVLKAIAVIIEEEFSSILTQNELVSFAYQKGKGVREALLQMKSLFRNNKASHVLKADIVNFFEEVNKDLLLKEKLLPKLKDHSIDRLINAALSQELFGVKWLKKEHWDLFRNAGKGIPQGNPMSPLLSNIYLSEFDEFCKTNRFNLVRYADDLVFVCQSEQEAISIFEIVNEFLRSKYSLKIHSLGNDGDKTLIIAPAVENELNFLGVDFDGLNLRPDKRCLGGLLSGIKSIIKLYDDHELAKKDIKILLNRWISVFSYSEIDTYFDHIDNFINRHFLKKFQQNFPRKFQCKKMAYVIRNRQRAENKNSFWNNVELKLVLPTVRWIKNWKRRRAA